MAEVTGIEGQSLKTEIQPKDFSQSGIVSLVVGKKRKKFEIHKDLLIKDSEYFKAIFGATANWRENQTKEVVWQEVNGKGAIAAVEIWVNWLYDRPIDKESNNTARLLHCYQLGHSRGMFRFQNDVIDAVRSRHNQRHTYAVPAQIWYCHRLNLRGTQMYMYLLRSWVHKIMTVDPMEEAYAPFREGFYDLLAVETLAQDFGKCLLEYRSQPWECQSKLRGCYFHDHSDGSSCAAPKENV